MNRNLFPLHDDVIYQVFVRAWKIVGAAVLFCIVGQSEDRIERLRGRANRNEPDRVAAQRIRELADGKGSTDLALAKPEGDRLFRTEAVRPQMQRLRTSFRTAATPGRKAKPLNDNRGRTIRMAEARVQSAMRSGSLDLPMGEC
jgi:hypothetical protein